ESTQDTDYRSKRSEYAVLEIGEYWIVDPQQEQVTIGILESGFYNTEIYQGEERVISRIFPNLTLTATQILTSHN
ncbi:Uma2 family endonuclease, partial [Spirulina sp. CS-785/01]|uniref:Uma2 family endonuclease n=1 Tax=Spirulina sp. CS-785/01 TaxID=3021716 RepID=UPI0023307A7C